MTLAAGTKLGSYEVAAPLGAGGMGEVYQAHDTKLGRDVAIKVLPSAFAHDPDKLSRFEREAKTLASLNHPNIAHIYGLEEIAGTSYLVMELVPGETLAEKIKREGAFPVVDALAIAKQIAEALEAAHEKGIVHRDLKPANVKVTPEGKVKVLDFGLAKAFAEDGAGQDIANSPTMTAAATVEASSLLALRRKGAFLRRLSQIQVMVGQRRFQPHISCRCTPTTLPVSSPTTSRHERRCNR
jgi:eukaryotic-like serine/threonine-protein kinase